MSMPKFVEQGPIYDPRPIKQRIADVQRIYNERDPKNPITWKEAKAINQQLEEERKSSNAKMYKNGLYRVTVYEGEEADEMNQVEEFKGRCTYLSIRREDNEPKTSWTDFQQIKNELTDPRREAIEIYPAQARVFDAANQYHLLVFPLGVILPFGKDQQKIKGLVNEISSDA